MGKSLEQKRPKANFWNPGNHPPPPCEPVWPADSALKNTFYHFIRQESVSFLLFCQKIGFSPENPVLMFDKMIWNDSNNGTNHASLTSQQKRMEKLNPSDWKFQSPLAKKKELSTWPFPK